MAANVTVIDFLPAEFSVDDLGGGTVRVSIDAIAQAKITGLVAALAALQPDIQFQDEGVNEGTSGGVVTVDFTGAGVTATEAAGVLTVDIPSGGAGALILESETAAAVGPDIIVTALSSGDLSGGPVFGIEFGPGFAGVYADKVNLPGEVEFQYISIGAAESITAGWWSIRTYYNLDPADPIGTRVYGAEFLVYVGGGEYIGTTVLTAASGNFTTGPSTYTIEVEANAAGGGGGGTTTAAAQAAVGGGGCAGGRVKKTFAVTPNTDYAYVNGAAGAAGAATGADGGTGGDTTFIVGAVTITAKGGLGGKGMLAGTTIITALGGATGGISTNGDVNSAGEPGGFSLRTNGTSATGNVSGKGGSSIFGAGGNSLNTVGTGNSGIGNGSGGGGGHVTNGSAAVTGGAGTAGITVVKEFT